MWVKHPFQHFTTCSSGAMTMSMLSLAHSVRANVPYGHDTMLYRVLLTTLVLGRFPSVPSATEH